MENHNGADNGNDNRNAHGDVGALHQIHGVDICQYYTMYCLMMQGRAKFVKYCEINEKLTLLLIDMLYIDEDTY